MQVIKPLDPVLEFENNLLIRSEAKMTAKRIMNLLTFLHEQVLALQEQYCMLVKLDRADTIDIHEYLSDEQIHHIEQLLKLYGLQCRVDF